jgi:large subunit ribosomal protein L6
MHAHAHTRLALLFPASQVEKNTSLIVQSADKVRLGAYCAEIRRQRPPEPYKGKGIRYEGEVIKLKEGKGGGKKK